MSLYQTYLSVALPKNISAINKMFSTALGFRAILYAIDVELLTELGLCRLKGLKIRKIGYCIFSACGILPLTSLSETKLFEKI